MYLKIFYQIIFSILLLNKLISSKPLTDEEQEEHINNRLKHYLQRIDIILKNPNDKFSSELQMLKDKFNHFIKNESFKEKLTFLENYTALQEFQQYLSDEFDKQYLNEDILMQCWYLNEILPFIEKDLHDETLQILHKLKELYRLQDLDEKIEKFLDLGENVSEKFIEYFYGEHEPLPLMNAQLKYYHEYVLYLLKEFKNVGEEFLGKLRDLAEELEVAKASDEVAVKQKLIDFFDVIDTKFGKFLDEYFADFTTYKFG